MAQSDELECERCGGDREVQANYGLVNWDEPRWVECPECDGTGRIDPDAFEDPYWEPRT